MNFFVNININYRSKNEDNNTFLMTWKPSQFIYFLTLEAPVCCHSSFKSPFI
jgi:hypothetical protein